MKTAELIRKHMADNNLSFRAMGELLGVSYTTLNHICMGRRPAPDALKRKLAELERVPLESLDRPDSIPECRVVQVSACCGEVGSIAVVKLWSDGAVTLRQIDLAEIAPGEAEVAL